MTPRILVRMDIAMSLEERGFEVVEEGNADEAVDLLNAHSDIRIMLTDIDMPGSVDGLKLEAAVRDCRADRADSFSAAAGDRSGITGARVIRTVGADDPGGQCNTGLNCQ